MTNDTSSFEKVQREAIAELIYRRLSDEKETLTAMFHQPGRIRSCFIDDLLPVELATSIYEAFPEHGQMRFNHSLREKKYVAAQMDCYDPILEDCVYAFPAPSVLADIAEITGLPMLEPDEHLYAGGISVMTQGNFLNPHLDNSHDKDRDRYRVLNLLYYVTPDWDENCGGNFELWDDGPEGAPREITSRFNRLVIMITDNRSWHSVNRVRREGRRCCVSNYYFSKQAANDSDYFHVTSFRGRAEQPIRDFILKGDIVARMLVRKVFRKGIRENPHVYKQL